MTLTQAILSRVGLFLDAESCCICVAVCKQWKEIFAPIFWHTVDHKTWRVTANHARSSRRPQEEQVEVNNRVLEHKDLIRDLTLTDHKMLYAMRMAGLTKLTSLTLDMPDRMSVNDYGTETVSTLVKRQLTAIAQSLATVAEDNRFDDEVPEELFQPLNCSVGVMCLTRAYWRMVLMNPNLQQLTFKIRNPGYIWPLGVVKETTAHGSSNSAAVLTSGSTTFLTNLLPNLRTMTHLEVGQNADEFLFLRLAAELPNLKSFVHSEYSQFDPDMLLAHSHTNLQNLVFRIAVLSPAQARAIVVAFPGLRSLSIPGCSITKEEILEVDLWEELVHPMLTTMSIDDPSGFVQCRVKFPNVRTLNCAVFLSTNLVLQRLLKAFPVVGHLEARSMEPKPSETEEDEEEFEIQSEHQIPRPCMIKTLIAYDVWRPSDRIDRVFCQMDLLVRLDVDWIGRRALRELGRVCTNLEYARFDLREGCSRELIGLFVGCPKLKECRGSGHEILADDIIGSAEWTCLGIRKLEIDVVGILRLSQGQETRLNTWRLNGNIELTEAEQDAMDLQLFSYEIQRQVYARLGRLRELKELYLGQHSTPKVNVARFTNEGVAISEGLEMTLASGLAELGGIKDLRMIAFDFEFVATGMEAGALAWLWERWSIKEGRRYWGYSIFR
ncbi:hypothetical protein BG015_011437 [Linnemannia schmuckeri]|uniref:F-box domain-containing protein n=1 Tax=Linnemannia schmuckeri TaxID=64567 RepID=A0A9P5V864_9FUNG|nr:hypothetical protein BG015_011437 [Linnemannia schmuckeri]